MSSATKKTYERHITWLYSIIDIFGQFWRPLAAFTRFWAATITRNHMRMAGMDSATQQTPEMTYHMCLS